MKILLTCCCYFVLLALPLDAAAQAPELIKDINPQVSAHGPFELIPFDNRLLFFANDGVNGHAPWITDGTTAGTHILKDVLPTTTGFEDFGPYWVGDGRAWFWGKDDFDMYVKLFLTDGSAAGTQLVDSVYGDNSTIFHQGWAVEDKLIFVQKIPLEDTYTFFQSDGDTITATGLEEPDILGSIIRTDSFYYQRLTMSPNIPGWTTDLIRSDGSPAGTTIVQEVLSSNTPELTQGAELYNLEGRFGYQFQKWIGPTFYKSLHVEGFPAVTLATNQQFGFNFTVFNNKLLYEAPVYPDSQAAPLALYAFDGSNTELLTTYYDTAFTHVASFEQIGAGKMLFRTMFPADSQRLWVTDGTAAGTHLLIDPKTIPGLSPEAELWQVYLNESKQEIYFHTYENQGKLCRFWSFHFADSTFNHLFDFSSVSPFGGNPVWRYYNNALIFTADDGLVGRELWKYQLYPVGVDDLDTNKPVSVEVFPNPVADELSFRLSDKTPQTMQWKLFDALGRAVQVQTFDTPPAGNIHISVKNLASGIYFYRLRDVQGKWVQSGKIYKQ